MGHGLRDLAWCALPSYGLRNWKQASQYLVSLFLARRNGALERIRNPSVRQTDWMFGLPVVNTRRHRDTFGIIGAL